MRSVNNWNNGKILSRCWKCAHWVAHFLASPIYLVLILRISLLKNSSRRRVKKLRRHVNGRPPKREAQNDWNYKLWQSNNEYNTPAAVQSRLRAAGINPDLYATNGALQGSSIQAQGGHTPSGPVADTSAWNRYKPIGSVASQALADTALSAQVAKTNAETEGQGHTNDIS